MSGTVSSPHRLSYTTSSALVGVTAAMYGPYSTLFTEIT